MPGSLAQTSVKLLHTESPCPIQPTDPIISSSIRCDYQNHFLEVVEVSVNRRARLECSELTEDGGDGRTFLCVAEHGLHNQGWGEMRDRGAFEPAQVECTNPWCYWADVQKMLFVGLAGSDTEVLSR